MKHLGSQRAEEEKHMSREQMLDAARVFLLNTSYLMFLMLTFGELRAAHVHDREQVP